ncbi:MAG: 4Fe-4S dicluster domain-containing protein [Deferribacteraceae bacterium]|jgi:molybdopterin-containing oxidoreductase family iron-sulfur binding subunit|nr:4Fe-4S dicluster domain-containing protein [Deferribacteraceae bacterium]
MKLAMIIDKRRCYGCHGCTVACKQANATPPGTFYTKVVHEEHGKFPNSRLGFMPLICNHCDNPPCVEVCPTGASKKLADGTVQVTASECIGCQSCMEVCPYGARYYNDPDRATTYWEGQQPNEYERERLGEHVPNTVDKCTFCAPRRTEGIPPACVETCPAKARIFGNIEDSDSIVAKTFKKYKPTAYKQEEGTVPSVFYIE